MTADPLREKLRAMLGTLRGATTGGPTGEYLRGRLAERDNILHQIAALLDETEEPEACSEWRHCEHDGEDGHVACDVLCADCGMRLEAHPPKPLPLGHPHDALYHTVADAKSQRCAKCGQPRSAHEPKG